uniref:Uncharacterized protein n=1 Tax=Arundo donax TaxID=35708 RepID=A0A0A9CHS4_ARUDO
MIKLLAYPWLRKPFLLPISMA